ncbi:MAG: hypothetical protein ABI601_15260 [bacterium]
MKRDLWLRLKHYHFEDLVPAHLADHVLSVFGGADAATRAFASKISKKHRWTQPFALRAIGEYRKFLYLGMVSETPVTPSKIIDMVWHEHLLFTRAYDEFCREVLGRPFDHHPELIGMEEQTEVFESQFEATVDLYESEFNTAPPADIWGVPKFAPGLARTKRSLTKRNASSQTTTSDDDAPLYTYFSLENHPGTDSMPEFSGGGGFSGAGGESSWVDSVTSGLHDGHSDSHGTDGASGHGTSDSTGGDGGSDGGGSDGGGSGCSSGCGGGGCGGGGD